jgi:hypothetical protein
MLDQRTIALAPQNLAVAHGCDQHATVGQEAKSRGLLGYVRQRLCGAIHCHGKHAVRIEIGNVQPSVAPSWTLGE